MYYLGVDIGGTTIKAGLVDEAGRLGEQGQIPTVTDNWTGFFSNLTALIRGYQSTATIQAVGIGVPGFHNSRFRQVRISPNIPCLTNASLEKLLADEVHVPVTTENDANAAAYAEFICGSGFGRQHMAYLTIGTGLGCGLILNGQLFQGASGYAAELGHTVIQPGGRPCPCGSAGCVETLVSAGGVVMAALELMKECPQSRLHALQAPLTSEGVFEAARAGDLAAQTAFERTGHWLGLVSANLINMLNLQLIALGGGVMAAGDMLMKPLLKTAARHSIAPSFNDCQIVQSKLGPDAGVVGAAMLARNAQIVSTS